MNQEDAHSLARAVLPIGGILAVALGATAPGANLYSDTPIPAAAANTGPIFGIIV